MSPPFPISILQSADFSALDICVASGGHRTEDQYFSRAYDEQIQGRRLVFLARDGDRAAGYVHLNFQPKYVPFLRLNIPEIQDLYVHQDYRRQGLGQALIAACLSAAREKGGEEIGIGVGIGSEFGAAQRLYVRLGFIPDGAGVVFDRKGVMSGDVKPLDERLCLMLVKSL